MLRLLSSTRVCTRLVNPAARTAAAAAVRPHRLPAMGLAPTHRTEAPARSYSASGHPSQAQAPTVAPLTPFRTHTPAPTASTSTPLVYTFYHDATSTWTYLVVDPATQHCAIIDSVLDYDPASHTVSTQTADALAAFVEQQGLVVDRIFETHAHADHLTAAAYLQLRLSPLDGAADGATRVPIGAHSGIRSTQAHFAQMYDVPPGELESAFDELYEEGDELHIGNLRGVVWHLPGHTMCSAGFVFGDSVFTGDSVLLPPTGTARADFPLGSASLLYASSQRLLSLPPQVRLFSGHSYPLEGASNLCSATVEEQRKLNPHVHEGVEEEAFVRMRRERDEGLKEPKLLHQSLQVNIRAGRLPRGKNGQPYFRTPIHAPTVL